MSIKYFEAPEIKQQVTEIAGALGFFHVVPQFIWCFRSKGSKSSRTIARIHGMGKIWQEALNTPAYYAIEVISERYDKLSKQEQEKVLIHELLHIPRGFTGGFRPHKGYIDTKTVESLYRALQKQRQNKRLLTSDTE